MKTKPIQTTRINVASVLLIILVLFSASVAVLLYPESFVLISSLTLLIISVAISFKVGGSVFHPLFMTLIAFIFYFGFGLFIIGISEGSFRSFFILTVGLLFFSSGGLLYNYLFKVNSRRLLLIFRLTGFEDTIIPSNIALFSLWLFGAFFYLYLILKVGVPMMVKDLSVRYKVSGFTNSFFELFWPISTVGFFIKSKKTNSRRLFLIAMFLATISAILYTFLLHRYALLQLLLCLFIAHIYVQHSEPKANKYISWCIIGGIIIFGIQYIRSSLEGTSLQGKVLIDITIKRLFIIGARTLDYIFDNFPKRYDFLHGLTYIRQLRNLYYPEDKVPSMGYFLYSEVTGYDTPGYDPISIIGEFFVNFGFCGLIFGMFVFGFLVQGFSARLLSRKSVYRLILFSVGSMLLIRSFAYSLPGNAYNFCIVTFGFIFLFILSRNFSK